LFETAKKNCHFFLPNLLVIIRQNFHFVDFRADYYRNFTKSYRIKKNQIFAEI